MVDPAQANQSIPVTVFNLNIARQNFAYGSANYTQPPTLQFANGDLLGFSFDVNLAGTGSPYLNVSVANGIATAIDAATGQLLLAPIANTDAAAINLDFSTITLNRESPYEIRMRITLADNTQKSVAVEVQPGATATGIRDLFKTALEANGIKAEVSGTTGLTISGSATKQLKKIEVFDDSGGNGPKYIGRSKGPDGSYPTYELRK